MSEGFTIVLLGVVLTGWLLFGLAVIVLVAKEIVRLVRWLR